MGALGAPPGLGASGSMPDTLTSGVKTDGMSTLPGPGTYNPEKDVKGGHNSSRKVATACFQS